MPQKNLAMIPVSKLELFLAELANLRDNDEPAFWRFVKRFDGMLEDVPSAEQWGRRDEERAVRTLETLRNYADRLGNIPRGVAQPSPDIPFGPLEETEQFSRIFDLRSQVRSIWAAGTLEEKKFRALLLQGVISSAGTPAFLLAPEVVKHFSPPGPFCQAILHLLESAHRALVCANPNCLTPFFWRKKKRQRYCSEICSGTGQREAKRKWWTENGEKWRKERQKKQRKQPSTNKGAQNVPRKTR